MIRAVLFDLYDTLVYVDAEAYACKISTVAKLVGTTAQEFDRAWFGTSSDSNAGKYSTVEERVSSVLERLGLATQEDIPSRVAEIERRFLSRDVHAFPDVAGVLRALRDSAVKLAIVTNASPSVEYVLAATSLRKAVDTVVISSEVKCAKPNPEIYERALDLLGIPAISACFVGDGNDRELDGACAVGMLTILLRRNRRRHGVRDSSSQEATAIIVSSLDEVLQIARNSYLTPPAG